MSIVESKSVLSGLTVANAMRRVVALLPVDASIEQATRCLIKFRANAILICDKLHTPLGVVSKTNLIGAYYAGLPIESPLEAIMVHEPICCQKGDSLESALDIMRKYGVHRVYVMEEGSNEAEGVLAYHDIMGLLYRYCHRCERNVLHARGAAAQDMKKESFTVQDVMRHSVEACDADQSLMEVMEGLETNQVRAVLVRGESGIPLGVVSRSDLLLAYRHGIAPESPARTIMHSPVKACEATAPLVLAIQSMLLPEVQRLFVYRDRPQNIVGVVSLSDAARVRSGSCRACTSSRIEVEEVIY